MEKWFRGGGWLFLGCVPPVHMQRLFNVYSTPITLERRQMNVQMIRYVSWVYIIMCLYACMGI